MQRMFERVLITGSGGMLGNAIFPYFRMRFPRVLATDRNLCEPWLERMDVTNRYEVKDIFDDFRPDLVLHLAAETNLEYCEANPDVAEAVNALGTETVSEEVRVRDATIVYISTAGVFDGRKEGLYTEADAPNPIMTYGRTKLDGEHVVRERCPKHHVVRAGWMVGGGPSKDHKFVCKILEQIAEGRTHLHAVNDKWGTPTYTHDFAMNLFALLERRAYGTYHMVCEGFGTRYDVAKEIVRLCGRDDLQVEAVDSSFFSEEYPAPRPRSEMLRNENLQKLGLNRMRPWKEALRDYIETEYPVLIEQPRALRGLSRATLRPATGATG